MTLTALKSAIQGFCRVPSPPPPRGQNYCLTFFLWFGKGYGRGGLGGETKEVNCQFQDIISKVLAGNLSSWKSALITWPRWWVPGFPTTDLLFCSLPYPLCGSKSLSAATWSGELSSNSWRGGVATEIVWNSFIQETCLHIHLLIPSFIYISVDSQIFTLCFGS